MGSSQRSSERIAVAAALAHLATSKDSSTSEPVKYRVRVTKEPHVDPGVAVHGGERKGESLILGLDLCRTSRGRGGLVMTV